MTWAEEAKPSIATLLPRNVRLRNRVKSTIGRFCSRSATTKSTSSAAAAASLVVVARLDQPSALASISAQTRQKRAPPKDAIPARSSRMASGSWDSSTAFTASAISTTPIGTLTRKAQRHPKPEVIKPPTRGPTATATPITVPQKPKARARSGPRNSCPNIASAALSCTAAPIPWRARATLRTRAVGARPHSSDAMVNTESPTIAI